MPIAHIQVTSKVTTAAGTFNSAPVSSMDNPSVLAKGAVVNPGGKWTPTISRKAPK